MKRKVVTYSNCVANGDYFPWTDDGGWMNFGDTLTEQAKDNIRFPETAFHLAIKSDGLPRDQGVWTAFYRWDAKKQKFICTRYRDVLRKAKRKQAVTSDA